MANEESHRDDVRERFEAWAREEAQNRWPDARVRYRSRAPNGSHHWEIAAPGVGEFWLAATDDVLEDPAEVDAAMDRLSSVGWLDRLPDVPGHGVQVKPGGRIFQWDPERDDTHGFLAP